jgi:ABC-type Zn uptake system ZnuABC Zn-binding protein ZnuA
MEAADLVVTSGAGLEAFMSDLLQGKDVIDCSQGIALLESHEHHHHEHSHHDHEAEADSHIWLSVDNAMVMAENIYAGLVARYPEHEHTFSVNLELLLTDFQKLKTYAAEQLQNLSCRELITFHDGFAYLADCFDLRILEAVEEESGREASAKELIHLIEEVEHHNLPAIFTEKSGSVSAAGIIARETGCGSFSLDMAMSGDSYFEAMYHNIDTIKEALG